MYPAAQLDAKVVYKEPLFVKHYFFMTVFIREGTSSCSIKDS